jgi:hypothetical protein
MSDRPGTSDEPEKARFGTTGASYWGGAWYPYWTIMVITVIGGFFGLDHFWLRSPLSGSLKILVNLLTLGSWWIYDIIQIFSHKERVLKTGLSIPFFGAQGIATGVFKDEPGVEGEAKAPWRWLGYLFVLSIPISFGMESVLGGDMIGGLIKFLCTLNPLTWILVLLWKCVDLYQAFVTPHSVWEKGLVRFFPWNMFIDPYKPTFMGPTDPLPGEGARFAGLGVFGEAVGMAVQPIVDTALTPVKAVTGAVTAAAETAHVAADSASTLMKAATGVAAPIVSTASSVVQTIPKVASAVPQITSGVTQRLASFQDPKKLAQLATQQVPGYKMSGGGASSSSSELWGFGITSVILLGAGISMGALRIKEILGEKLKNGTSSRRDDRPPNP